MVLSTILLVSVTFFKGSIGACVPVQYYGHICNSVSDFLSGDSAPGAEIVLDIMARSVRDLVDFPEIPASFAENVTHLTIRNSLKRIQNGAFKNFRSLERLLINNNNLRIVGIESFGPIPTLVRLSLDDNNLRSVAKGAFEGLPKLRFLHIISDRLGKVASGVFGNLPAISLINLGNSSISGFEASCFVNATNLQGLVLYLNKIASFDSGHLFGGKKANLLTLTLSHNLLTEITANSLKDLPKLKYVFLNFNSISKIDPGAFAENLDLVMLDLSRNKLTVLNPEILPDVGLQFLDYLLLNNNRIMYLEPDFMDRLQISSYLSFSGNPWICPCFNLVLKWMEDNGIRAMCDEGRQMGNYPSCVVATPDLWSSSTNCSFVYEDRFVAAMSGSYPDLTYCYIMFEYVVNDKKYAGFELIQHWLINGVDT